MAKESLKAFFEALDNDPRVKDLVKGLAVPERPEDAAKPYLEIAGKLGFDVTEDEIKAALEVLASQKAKTEEAAGKIAQVDDEELGKVAGGAGKSGCTDTYLDKENCWVTDGCDNVLLYYENYLCARHNLGNTEPLNLECQKVIL